MWPQDEAHTNTASVSTLLEILRDSTGGADKRRCEQMPVSTLLEILLAVILRRAVSRQAIRGFNPS